jgi:hypothetical protein
MSLASIKVENALSFASKAYSHIIPASDKVMTKPLLSDTYGVADEIIQDGWTFVSPQSSNYGQSAVFVIPKSVGSIYELVLEATFPADVANTALCPYAIVKLIDSYDLSIGGSLINTDGEAMFATRQSYLTEAARRFYAAQAGGTSSANVPVGSTAVTQFMVVDYPGSYSVNQSGTTFTHDDSYGIPFPLNRCNQDMIITINLANVNTISAGSAQLTAQPTLRLHYQTIWSSKRAKNLTNVNDSGSDIFIPGYVTQRSPVTVNVGTNPIQVPLNGQMKNGQLLKLLVKLNNSANVTAKNYFKGATVNTLKLNVTGNDFYKVTSTQEAAFKDGLNKRGFSFVDGCQDPIYYDIWGSSDPYLIASDEYMGVNIYQQNPYLELSSATANNVTSLDYITVIKALFKIDRFGAVNLYTTSSGQN